MQKMLNKVEFTLHVAALGATLRSRFVLIREAIRIQINCHTNGQNRPYSCVIGDRKRSALVRFRGTLDELHALTEIFVNQCYKPPARDIHTVLDLGANIGLASIWLWLRFEGCRIDAYEPDPETFKLLKENLTPLTGVRSVNRAIADKAGTMTFHSAARSFSSSIYAVPSSIRITVQTKTLDQAIAELGGTVDFVKMDIEGAEFDVFETAKSLGNIRYIIGEAHPKKASRSMEGLIRILSRTYRFDAPPPSKGKGLFRVSRLGI